MLFQHPQLVDRRFFETLVHGSIGEHPVFSLPYRFSSVDRWTHRATATMGFDNHDVLSRILGLDDADIAQLETEGIIGTKPKGM